MAIGGNYENNGSYNNGYQGNNSGNNGNRPFENTYYSRFRLKNGNDVINISYRSGLMILDMGSIGSEGFKFNSAIQIYLSPMKAHMLVSQIHAMLEYRKGDNIDPNKGFGVNTGMGEKVSFIAFSTDADKIIYITIGKFDNQGTITESYKFALNHNYNYSLEWDNVENNNLSKVYDEDAEIIMLMNAIEDFSRSMNGAIGYAVADTARWDQHRLNKRIDQMFDKMGIERQSYGSSNRGGSNNFLNNASSSSSKSTTIEDMEDLLD